MGETLERAKVVAYRSSAPGSCTPDVTGVYKLPPWSFRVFSHAPSAIWLSPGELPLSLDSHSWQGAGHMLQSNQLNDLLTFDSSMHSLDNAASFFCVEQWDLKITAGRYSASFRMEPLPGICQPSLPQLLYSQNHQSHPTGQSPWPWKSFFVWSQHILVTLLVGCSNQTSWWLIVTGPCTHCGNWSKLWHQWQASCGLMYGFQQQKLTMYLVYIHGPHCMDQKSMSTWLRICSTTWTMHSHTMPNPILEYNALHKHSLPLETMSAPHTVGWHWIPHEWQKQVFGQCSI